MKTFEDHTSARNGIMDFRADHGSEVPKDLRDRFRSLSASPAPVDQYVNVGEFIYANRDRMPPSALDLAAGLIAFATANMWHGLAVDGRGERIVANLRKDLGEVKTAPAAPEPAMGMRVDVPAPAAAE